MFNRSMIPTASVNRVFVADPRLSDERLYLVMSIISSCIRTVSVGGWLLDTGVAVLAKCS